MLKKFMFALAVMTVSVGFAFAAVEVNKADQAALDGVRGVGPKMSKNILDERKKGEFKDWTDLEARVKGVGEKNALRLSEAGLTVNGRSRDKSNAGAGKTESKGKADARERRKDVKKEDGKK